MSITDNVINTALLGTANRELSAEDLPEDLGDTLLKIKETAADGEDDAIVGLMSLGYTRAESAKAVKRAKESGAASLEDIIMTALKSM